MRLVKEASVESFFGSVDKSNKPEPVIGVAGSGL
jgi:hypothetical protein